MREVRHLAQNVSEKWSNAESTEASTSPFEVNGSVFVVMLIVGTSSAVLQGGCETNCTS
jgi:hypothetical protein